MKTLSLILCILFLSLQYKLWFGAGGIRDWLSLREKTAQQIRLNASLEKRNHGLLADVDELKNGDQALEEQARQALGMVKEGELYIQLK